MIKFLFLSIVYLFPILLFGQKNYFDIDLTGSYSKNDSANTQYQLLLKKINPSAYYYEILSGNSTDSEAKTNLTCGVFSIENETGSYVTTATGSFKSGFLMSVKEDGSIYIDIMRFSSDDRYRNVVGNYKKDSRKLTEIEMGFTFYNPNNFFKYKSISAKKVYLFKYPQASNQFLKVDLVKSDELRTLFTVYNFDIGNMAELYYYVKAKHGGQWIEGWLSAADLKYFSFDGKYKDGVRYSKNN